MVLCFSKNKNSIMFQRIRAIFGIHWFRFSSIRDALQVTKTMTSTWKKLRCCYIVERELEGFKFIKMAHVIVDITFFTTELIDVLLEVYQVEDGDACSDEEKNTGDFMISIEMRNLFSLWVKVDDSVKKSHLQKAVRYIKLV